MISLNDITVTFSGKDLLTDVTFQINREDKIGLIGKNGTGKSTLLKIITGEIKEFSGSINIQKELRIGYLPQFLPISDTRSVFEEAFSAFDEFKELNAQFDKLNHQLTNRTDYQSAEYHKLIDKINELSHILALNNENQFIAQTEKILKGLGFTDNDFKRPTAEFSGGWRMRIEIAKILLRTPDVLLLDEPTNHLDINSIQWFEDFLKDYKNAVVIVSHDKRFLNNVTNRTIEIILGQIYDFDLPYTQYLEFRRELRQQQKSAFENQQQKIKQAEQFIERFRYKATKAAAVQSRVKMLEKMQVVEIDDEDNSAINFHFPPAPRAGDLVIQTQNLTKRFGEHVVFQNVDFTLERNEKIAFVGKNGQGKTTFVRILINELEYEGTLKIGHNVSIGYYAQNQDQILDPTKTVFETLDDIAVGDIRTQLRKILGSFLFRNDDIDKKVGVLSGGERARLALAKMILQPYSLLILDEPTNHLDIAAKDILKQALLLYDGTVIIVSHDRDFLEGFAKTVYEFADTKVKQYRGDINYFLEKKKIEFVDQISLNIAQNKQNENTQETSENKEDFLRRKELKKQQAKIQRQIEQVEIEINQIEERINEIEKMFAIPENASNMELINEYGIKKKLLDQKMILWENLHTEISSLE